MIVDTGILLAAVDAKDIAHAVARAVLSFREQKVVTGPCLTEADWLIEHRYGPDVEMAFLTGLDGALVVLEPEPADRARAIELIARYRDLSLGYVDATTIAMAERLGERRIATLDAARFGAVKPRHADAFELLPQSPA